MGPAFQIIRLLFPRVPRGLIPAHFSEQCFDDVVGPPRGYARHTRLVRAAEFQQPYLRSLFVIRHRRAERRSFWGPLVVRGSLFIRGKLIRSADVGCSEYGVKYEVFSR